MTIEMGALYKLRIDGTIDLVDQNFEHKGIIRIEGDEVFFNSINPSHWERDQQSRVFPTEFMIMDHELERIKYALNEHEIDFPGFLFPAVSLSFFISTKKKYEWQDFENQLYILDRIKEGYEIDGFSLKLTRNESVETKRINEKGLNQALKQYLLYYLGSQEESLQRSIKIQENKQAFSHFKTNRNKACFDAFSSLSKLEISDNSKFVNIGKLLAATSHIDGYNEYGQLMDNDTEKSTYKSYNDFLKDRARSYVRNHLNYSG